MKVYFTFMQRQAFRKYYVIIIANDMNAARGAMFEHFGEKWMTGYEEKDFLPQIDTYNLKHLMTIDVSDGFSQPFLQSVGSY